MYARAEAEIVGSLCSAVFKIEADEVTALGVGPMCDARARKISLKSRDNYLELGADDLREVAHVAADIVGVAVKITHVADLVDLIETDRLNIHNGLDELKIVLRSGKDRNTRAGEGDL